MSQEHMDEAFDLLLCRVEMGLDQIFDHDPIDKALGLAKLNMYEANICRIIQKFRNSLQCSTSVSTMNLMLTDNARVSPLTNYFQSTVRSEMPGNVLDGSIGCLNVTYDSSGTFSDHQILHEQFALDSDPTLDTEPLITMPCEVEMMEPSYRPCCSTTGGMDTTIEVQAGPSRHRRVRQPTSHRQSGQHVRGRQRCQRKKLGTIDGGLYRNVYEQLGKSHSKQTDVVCKFYQAVTSLDALTQLQAMIRLMRDQRGRRIDNDASSVAGIMLSLEQIDRSEQINGFQRRILLLRLHTHLQEVTTRLELTQPCDKLSSLVRDELMVQAFPDIGPPPEQHRSEWRKKYSCQRKILENRLYAAKHWHLAVERFELGLIALLPTGGEFHIQNQSYETLHEASCDILFQLLIDKSGGFVTQAAQYLTPFVQDIYDGIVPPAAIDIQHLYDLHAQLVVSARGQIPSHNEVNLSG